MLINESDTSHSMNTHTSKEVIDPFKENRFEHCNLLTDDDEDQNITVRKRRPAVVIKEHPANQDTFKKATKKMLQGQHLEYLRIVTHSDVIWSFLTKNVVSDLGSW